MEGITILSETVKQYTSTFGCITLICIGVIILIIGILCLVAYIQEGSSVYAFISIIVILLSFIVGAVGIMHLSDKPYTVYKVTIDENVSFKEFNEKYEIIEQDGSIYEVKEK